VVAPIAGIVGNIPVKVGDFVQTSTTLTNIIQNGALELNLSIPAERGPELREGLPVELLDAQSKPIGRGSISFISPEVNTAQQSILAKARFPNSGTLRDGQFVRARVIWNSSSSVLVPTTAITRIAGQPFVFVLEQGQGTNGQPQQVARQRPVKLGNLQGNNYQVLEGVKSGEQLIVSGLLNLQDGVPVQVVPAASPAP
jgi:RND family efflux transporter MFP subunit